MRVYVIQEKDLKEQKQTIYGIYAKKEIAKKIVDVLNSSDEDIEDPTIIYTIESFDVIQDKEDFDIIQSKEGLI